MSSFTFDRLISAITDNSDYFCRSEDKFWYASEYAKLLGQLLNCVKWYQDRLPELKSNAHKYDLNADTPGNGYRTFDLIFERCFLESSKFCEDLICARSSLIFRASESLKTLKAHVTMLEGLKSGLTFLLKLLENNPEKLLSADKHLTAEELIEQYGVLNQIGFYGRLQGFYYCPSMRKTLRGVSSILASFSDLYQKEGSPLSRAISSVINVIKYVLCPELRSQQIVNVAQNASVEFLKAFWSLNEMDFMKKLPRWICPKLKVSTELYVPTEPVILEKTDGSDFVVIPVPSSHIPPAPVRCLLLSSDVHKGQVLSRQQNRNSARSPLSPALLIHCHGGGFIAQSPESHEIYLRYWANELKVPILSIDYSLAPTAPFPRALEEVLLVYAWCLKNPRSLGWTGERICFVGDSAGGNILMGTVLKAISLGIRKPDAILCAYTPLILDMVLSPSRLLCWLDPLLPLGFMINCLSAYAGDVKFEDEYVEDSASLAKSPHERKLSSISEIFSSSIHFIKQSEWLELDPGEITANYSSRTCSSEVKNEAGQNKLENLKIPNTFMESQLENYDYVATFAENYLDCLSSEGLPASPEDNKDHVIFNFPEDLIFIAKSKYSKFVLDTYDQISDFIGQSSILKKIVSPLTNFLSATPPQADQNHFLPEEQKWNIAQKIKKLKMVARDPFMSPLLASDELLKDMPPVYFMSLNFDPCLDDSITFCQRLSALDRPVVIDVVDGLPHGYLNFLPFSQEAHNGSDLCIERLREALKLTQNVDNGCCRT